MSMRRPSFWDSPYFVPEPGNWHLTVDAPEDIKKAFIEYENTYQKTHHIDSEKETPKKQALHFS